MENFDIIPIQNKLFSQGDQETLGMLPQGGCYKYNFNMKAICLIYAYVNNITLSSDLLKTNTKEIILLAPLLLNVCYKCFKFDN